jgi:hypothetical protein
MNQNLKIFLITLACIFIAGASLTYGALTAPGRQTKQKPVATQTPQPTKVQLEQKLVQELPLITSVLVSKYPLIASNYTIEKGQLFDRGQWFGTTLTYHGPDNDNRDTLRVLLQKKGEVWTLRTTPPRPLLSAKDFPDVPLSILKTINQPVSLPGTSNSPTIGG